MLSLKDFVAALQAGWFVALIVLIACSIFILGDHCGIPYLDLMPPDYMWILVGGWVFSFSMVAANILRSAAGAWISAKDFLRRRKLNKTLINEIYAMSDEERFVLLYLLIENKRAFSAHAFEKKLIPLVTRGLVIKQKGSHNLLAWPYVVHPEVWTHLNDNRDTFGADLPDGIPEPFEWGGGLL